MNAGNPFGAKPTSGGNVGGSMPMDSNILFNLNKYV